MAHPLVVGLPQAVANGVHHLQGKNEAKHGTSASANIIQQHSNSAKQHETVRGPAEDTPSRIAAAHPLADKRANNDGGDVHAIPLDEHLQKGDHATLLMQCSQPEMYAEKAASSLTAPPASVGGPLGAGSSRRAQAIR